MRRSILSLIAGCLFAVLVVTPTLSQELVGTVADRDGQVVPGAKIIVHSPDGQMIEAVTSDANGQYQTAGLAPGEYFITLDSAGTGVQGQTVASYMDNAGLTVNWSVAPGTPALASAQPGIHLTSGGALTPVSTIASARNDPPPGCGVNGGTTRPPGPPCGPKKKSGRRCTDNGGGNNGFHCPPEH